MFGSWADAFYRFVNQSGFSDPIHAALVHLPMGLVIGAWIFAFAGVLSGRGRLALTARHCIILTCLSFFPVVLFGLMDWLHFYHGAWLPPIKMKMILAGTLFLLLLVGLIAGASEKAGPKKVTLLVYTLCLGTVVLLGWFGARLVYAGSPGGGSAYGGGGKIFEASCAPCHPGGGNVIDPDKSLQKSNHLKDIEGFVSYIRKPQEPMPAFSSEQVSERDAKELYLYVTQVLVPSMKQK